MAVEVSKGKRADWFVRRLFEPIGTVPSAEAEARYGEKTERQPVAA